MPVPDSYTEEKFSDVLWDKLGNAHPNVLGWTRENSGHILGEVIVDTLLDYGVNTVEEATDIKKVRVLGVLHLWQMVCVEYATRFPFSADGSTFDRNLLFDQAQKMLERAEIDAIPYLPQMQLNSTMVKYADDPYRPASEISDDEYSEWS